MSHMRIGHLHWKCFRFPDDITCHQLQVLSFDTTVAKSQPVECDSYATVLEGQDSAGFHMVVILSTMLWFSCPLHL